MKALLAVWSIGLGGAAQPAPEPGTVFIFSQGRVERFLRSEEDDMRVWSTRSGREYVRAANPAIPVLSWRIGNQSGSRRVIGNADAIWPPEPGRKARFRVLTRVEANGVRRRVTELWRCEVKDEEVLWVPAGRFATLPIECIRYSTTSMRPLQQRIWWWAPDVGHYIRREFANMRSGETLNVTLCAALPAYRATPVRVSQIASDDCRNE